MLRKEEEACASKMDQIEDMVDSVQKMDEALNDAAYESEIDLLKNCSERKNLCANMN